MWCCMQCLPIVKTVYQMPQPEFDEFERKSLAHGGEKGGEYLDQIGRTNLAELNEEQWTTFLGKILDGYSTRMREFAEGRAPF